MGKKDGRKVRKKERKKERKEGRITIIIVYAYIIIKYLVACHQYPLQLKSIPVFYGPDFKRKKKNLQGGYLDFIKF